MNRQDGNPPGTGHFGYSIDKVNRVLPSKTYKVENSNVLSNYVSSNRISQESSLPEVSVNHCYAGLTCSRIPTERFPRPT